MALTIEHLEEIAAAFMAKASEACLERYKDNRNPMLAALYDPDPEIRSGSAFLLAYMNEKEHLLTANTLPVLKARIRTETDIKVKIIMEAMYERISGKE